MGRSGRAPARAENGIGTRGRSGSPAGRRSPDRGTRWSRAGVVSGTVGERARDGPRVRRAPALLGRWGQAPRDGTRVSPGSVTRHRPAGGRRPDTTARSGVMVLSGRPGPGTSGPSAVVAGPVWDGR